MEQYITKNTVKNAARYFLEVEQWFSSSKLCSNCLYYHPDLVLADWVFHCPLYSYFFVIVPL